MPRRGEEVEEKLWEKKALEQLKPRDCPYRQYPKHYLITCPDCCGFPLD